MQPAPEDRPAPAAGQPSNLPAPVHPATGGAGHAAADKAAADGGSPPARPFHLEEAVAVAIMALLCLITLGNVITRYLTSISFAFTEEFSIYLLVVLTFVGAATAFTRGQHLAIDFLAGKLPGRWRARQRRFALLCALLMFGLLAWQGALMCWDDYETGITSPGLGLPQWWYTLAVPVLSALVVLRIAQQLFRRQG